MEKVEVTIDEALMQMKIREKRLRRDAFTLRFHPVHQHDALLQAEVARVMIDRAERCAKLEGAIKAARMTLSAAMRMEMFDGPAIKEASAILRDALEVPDGE